MGWQDDPVVEAAPVMQSQAARAPAVQPSATEAWRNDPVVQPQAGGAGESEMERWVKANMEAVQRIGSIENPSRSDFEKVGLPRMPAAERAALAKVFREYRPAGAMETAVVGLGSGTIQTGAAAGGLVDAAGDAVKGVRNFIASTGRWNPLARMLGAGNVMQTDGEKNALQEIGTTAHDFYSKKLDEISKVYPQGDVTRNPALLADPAWWSQGIGNALSSMSTAVVTGGGTAAAGAVVGAGMEALPNYEDLKSQGLKPSEAATRSALFGVAVAALDKIGLDRIFKGDPLSVKKVVMTALKEGGTEAAEEPAQAIASYAAREGVGLTEFGLQVLESLRKGANTFFSAAVAGGAMGAAGGMVERKAWKARIAEADAAQKASPPVPPEQIAEDVAKTKAGDPGLEARKKAVLDSIQPEQAASEPTAAPDTQGQAPEAGKASEAQPEPEKQAKKADAQPARTFTSDETGESVTGPVVAESDISITLDVDGERVELPKSIWSEEPAQAADESTGDTKSSPAGENPDPEPGSPGAPEAQGPGEAVARAEKEPAETPPPQEEPPAEPETPEPPPSTTVMAEDAPGNPPLPTTEVPLDKLRLSKDVPQFKEDADAATGVVEPLEGKYERMGTPPIVVWERANGDLEVITGRHRFDLAKRSGEKTIPAQVVREKDGFTKEKAAIFDAEANIRDGQGKVKDYANYFRAQGVSREEASGRGLLSRNAGRQGYALGRHASDDLYALYRAGKIGVEKAVAIANAAPGNSQLQSLGYDYAKSHDATETAQYLKALQVFAPQQSAEQIDMFGENDTWKVEAERVAKAASAKISAISDETKALKSALSLSGESQQKILQQYGVEAGDADAIEARLLELKQEADKWSRWETSPDLQRQLRSESTTKEAPPPGPQSPLKGVGAAASAAEGEGEFLPKARVRGEQASDYTGVRRSVAEIERKALGYPEEIRDVARKFPEVVADAWDRVVQNANALDELVAELKVEPRPLTDTEVAMLLIAKVQRFNARNAAASETVRLEKTGTQQQKEEAQERYQRAAERLEEIFDVAARGAGKSITMTARGLSAMRMLMDDQFNLVEMEQAVRAKQGGKALSEIQRAQLEAIKKEYDEAKKALEAELKRLEEANAKLEAENKAKDEELANAKANEELSKIVKELLPKKGQKRTFKEAAKAVADQFEADYDAYMKASMTRVHAVAIVTDYPMRLVVMAKMGAAYIIRGTIAVSEWTSAMKAKFADATDKELAAAYERAQILAEAAGQRDDAEEKAKRKNAGRKQNESPKEKAPSGEPTIKELFRAQVVAGFTDLNTIVKNVHEIVKAGRPGITPEQVRDEFSDYGKSRPMSRDEVSKTLADLRRQAQLLASIERVMAELAPLKSGPQRDKPSQKVRELTRKLNAMMKEAGISTRDPETQLASALAGVKTRLQNSIDDLEKAIANREKMVANKKTIQHDNEAKLLKQRRDALRAEYDELFPAEPMSDEERLKRAISAAERNLEGWNQRLKDARSGKWGKDTPAAQPWSARLSELKKQVEAAKDEVERLHELAHPKKSPEQAAIDAKKKRIEKQIAEMEQRMKDGNFAPKKRAKVEISGDPEAMKAQARLAEVKKKFAVVKEAARRANRTPSEIAKETALEIMHTQKNLISAFDLSAPGRQGGYLMLSNPVIWLRAWLPMLRSLSKARSAQENRSVFERENAKSGVYARSGLVLYESDGEGNFTDSVEDSHLLDLASKVPGVNASNRTYATFLNHIRADLFDKLLANTADPSDVSDAKIKAIAAGVNILTGRGDVGRHAETMSLVLWAPRFLKSAFDVLTAKPLRSGTRESRVIFAKQYARMLGSMALIYMIAALFRRDRDKEKVEWDPRSSDFGAIPFGEHKINPLGFVRPLLVFLTRSATGQTKGDKGVTNLREILLPIATEQERQSEVPYKGGYSNTAWAFLQSKLHPTWGTALSLMTGKKFGGREKQTLQGAAADVTLPLSPRQAYEIASIEPDWDAAVTLSILNILGFEVKPDYQSRAVKAYQAGSPEEFRKEIGKILYAATGEKATDADRALAQKATAGMSKEDVRAALLDAVQGKRVGAKHGLRIRESDGGLSSYGLRLSRLPAAVGE